MRAPGSASLFTRKADRGGYNRGRTDPLFQSEKIQLGAQRPTLDSNTLPYWWIGILLLRQPWIWHQPRAAL